MNKIDTICEHLKLRLIAAAIGHQQCTKTAANIVPIPGGERVIAIGTRAEVARLLELGPAELAAVGMCAAADFIDKRAAAYADENASLEHDTGATSWHYGEAGRNYYNTLVELAEDLRNAASVSARETAHVDLVDSEGGHHD